MRRTIRSENQNQTRAVDPLDIVNKFVQLINKQDVNGLCELMTQKHRFVDPTGQAHLGRETMRAAWENYFSMFPDYRITVKRIMTSGSWVALFGTTSATYAPNGTTVRMYAAWLAKVTGKRVHEWQVFADNEPARAAMRK